MALTFLSLTNDVITRMNEVTLTSTGFLAGGTNGQTMLVNTGAANTFTAHVTTTDTIDVKLIAGSADVTSGILRVIACCIDTGKRGRVAPTEVDRDLLA